MRRRAGVYAGRVTRLLDWRSEPDLPTAAEAIRSGSLIIVPTDTCYGLACDAFDADAVTRLKSVRSMPTATPLTVLAADAEVVNALASNMSPTAQALAQEFWPGPLTMLMHAQASLQWDLGAFPDSVAIRVPNHDVLRALLRMSGPLAVSQASPVGEKPPYTVDEALLALNAQVEVAVEGGRLPGAGLSTLVDCREGQLDMLRTGGIAAGDLLRVAGAAGGE